MILSFRAHIRSSHLLKTAFGSFGMKVVAAGIGFVSSILLARLLGPKELGIYALAIATINLMATVLLLGLPALVSREVAKCEAREQWGLLKGLLHTSHRWVAMATITALAVSSGVMFAGIVLPNLSWLTLACAMILIPLTSFSQLRASFLRGLHHVILADIPELLFRPTLMLLLVAGAYLWLGHANAEQAIIFQLVAVIPTFMLGTWFMHDRTPQPVTSATPQTQARAWVKEAYPFFLIAIIGLLEGQMGLYLLGYFSNSEQVGLFQVASQLVGLVVMGLVSVNLPLQPKLAAAWARGDKAGAQRLITDATRLGTVVALVSAVILLPGADLVIHLYGDQYVGAANVLRILVVGQFINAASGPCGLVLATTGQQRLALYGITVALVVNALVGALLAYRFGAIGAALAATTGMLVWNGLLVYWAYRHLKIRTPLFWFVTNWKSL